jgi:hypothetical protein
MQISPANPLACTNSQLRDAVASSTNWRQVLRALGFNGTSAGPIRRIKRQAAGLGLDTSHFRGKRGWSDGQLRRAVREGHSWADVLAGLGLAVGTSDVRTRIKAHAIRLGLDVTHLDPPPAEPSSDLPAANLAYLREAATSIAAAWFGLRGCNAALPVEPAVYDLLVTTSEGIKRVQVKTTTHNSKDGWQVIVSRRPYSVGNLEKRLPYDPEIIDFFLIVDGDLNIYLIPSRVIAGRVGISLRTYKKYIVGNASGLMVPGRSHAA